MIEFSKVQPNSNVIFTCTHRDLLQLKGTQILKTWKKLLINSCIIWRLLMFVSKIEPRSMKVWRRWWVGYTTWFLCNLSSVRVFLFVWEFFSLVWAISSEFGKSFSRRPQAWPGFVAALFLFLLPIFLLYCSLLSDLFSPFVSTPLRPWFNQLLPRIRSLYFPISPFFSSLLSLHPHWST